MSAGGAGARTARTRGVSMSIFTQDDPTFPRDSIPSTTRRSMSSWHHDIETVPTLLRVDDGEEVDRTVGWSRPAWEALTGVAGLGRRPARLPARLRLAVGRPRSRRRARGPLRRLEAAEPAGRARRRSRTRWRRCSTAAGPTACPSCRRPRRASLRMLEGTTRAPDEIVAVVPPDLVECTVEKVAINAVMAGCRPEYLPGGARRASRPRAPTSSTSTACSATTMPVGPVRHRQRADRARHRHELRRQRARPGQPRQRHDRPRAAARHPQRRRRPPGGVDRATHGNPGKFTFCFAEDEDGSPWEPLSVERGFAPGAIDGDAVRRRGPAVRRRSARRATRSRWPARSPRACAPSHHPKLRARLRRDPRRRPRARAGCSREAGWIEGAAARRARRARCSSPGDELVRGAGGIAEGHARAASRDATLPEVPRRRPAASCTPAAAPACSRPSSAAGRTARSAASRSHEGGRHDDAIGRARPDWRASAAIAERALRRGRARSTARRVGLLDISKPRGNVFLDRLEELLDARGVDVERFAKPTFTKPAPVDLRHEIATQVRRGDRGPRRLRQSCTSCSVHDIVDLEAAGVPAVFVASTEFVEAADAQAQCARLPTAARVFVPHPIQDRTDDEIGRLRRRRLDEILAASRPEARRAPLSF